MSQQKAPPVMKQMSSLAENPDTEFMHADSIYIDPKMSTGSVTDDPYLSQSVANESGVPTTLSEEIEGKNSRKRREERHLREQTNWLRSKFDLRPSEQLIASFSAALLRHILLQGRIYITTSHICFHSRLFGKVTKDLFDFSAIKRVKKRRGGLVANAIKIYFLDDNVSPVLIGSLNNREKAFELIQGRLRDINPAASERKDDDDGSIASVGSGRDDSDERSVEGNETYASNQINGTTSISLSARNSIENTDVVPKDNSDADSGNENNNPNHNVDADMVWQTPDDVVGQIFGKEFDKRTERARVVLDAPVKHVFNVLYISNWLKTYHEDVKNRDVTISDWTRATDGFMTRQVNFCRPLGYKLGPKETRVKETQRYSFTKKGGVVIEIQGENLDVPYASCFVVESFFELDPYGEDGERTLMVASVAVHFVKSTFLHGTIQSGALNETKTTFGRMVSMAKDRVCQFNAEKQSCPAKTSQAQSCNRVHFKTITPPQETNGHRTDFYPDTASAANTTDDAIDATGVIDADDVNLSQSTQIAALDPSNVTVDAEHHDVRLARIVRFVTLAVLVVTCLLLVNVLFTLRRLHHSVITLERKIIREEPLLVSGDDGHCNSTL